MDPKGLLQWYYSVKDSHGAPALSFIDSTGRLHGKNCLKCNSNNRHSKKNGEPVCGYCGSAWPYEERYLLKGEIQRSLRFNDVEMRNAKQFDVGIIVHHLLRDYEIPGHLYVANTMGVSIRKLILQGPEYWPRWEFTWTKHAVHRAIQQGAALWQESLTKAGIKWT